MKIQLRPRPAAAGIALGLMLLGGWLSTGTPDITIVNDGLGIAYPWRRGFGSLMCAAGFLLLAAALRRVWSWALAVVLAVVAVGGGLYQWTYRVEAGGEGIAARRFFRRSSIPWRDVQHVGNDETMMVVSGSQEREITIDTTDFSPSQRLALSRTITRRVNEVTGAPPPQALRLKME